MGWFNHQLVIQFPSPDVPLPDNPRWGVQGRFVLKVGWVGWVERLDFFWGEDTAVADVFFWVLFLAHLCAFFSVFCCFCCKGLIELYFYFEKIWWYHRCVKVWLQCGFFRWKWVVRFGWYFHSPCPQATSPHDIAMTCDDGSYFLLKRPLFSMDCEPDHHFSKVSFIGGYFRLPGGCCCISRWWFQVLSIFTLAKWPNFTNMFQMGCDTN